MESGNLHFLDECGRGLWDHATGSSGCRENSEDWIQPQPSEEGERPQGGPCEGLGAGSEGEDVRVS